MNKYRFQRFWFKNVSKINILRNSEPDGEHKENQTQKTITHMKIKKEQYTRNKTQQINYHFFVYEIQ